MKNSLETKLGIFVFLAVFAAWAIVETLGGPDWFRHGIHLSARFATVQDLKPGDRVKMAGVEIGKVESMQLTNSKVQVIMKLHEDAVVKTDSKASIQSASLMGQNFVDIDFGSPGAEQLKDGNELVTFEQPGLSAVIAKLGNAVDGIGNLTKAFPVDDFHNVLGPLGDFIKNNKDSVSASLSNVSNITAQIASGQGTVGKLIYDDSLYSNAMVIVNNLHPIEAKADNLFANVNQVVTNLSAGKGTLGKLLTDDTLHRQLTEGLTNLDQILLKINQTNGTLGKVINDPEMYKNVKLTMQKVDKATETLEDQGPLSILSLLATPLGL
jgi:phospholipid/cholesterol/gamma-HCH transport system substrate-binding protein